MNKDLTVGNERSVIIRFTLPLLGSMLFQQLYNIADSFVAGKFISSSALAAVGNSYEITLIFLAFATGLNMGASVIISQYYGAKRLDAVKSAITTTFIFTLIIVALLTLFGVIFTRPLLLLINTPEETFSSSALYLDIYIYGLVFMFLYNIATGVFTAMGDSKTPFIFLAFSSTANIAVDVLFVKAFDMGVAGVAWATFLCQGVSALLSLIALTHRLKGITSGIKAPIFSLSILKKIVAIAVPSILQQSFISVGNIIVQSIINSFGAIVMAGYAAAIKLNNLVITSLTTIGNGVSSFTAQNLGAEKVDRVVNGRRGALLMAEIFALAAACIYIFAGRTAMRFFVNSADLKVIDVGLSFFRVVTPFYIVVTLKIITDGVLRGSGAMKAFMIATFSDLILRASLSYVFSRFLPLIIPGFDGVIGIWLSWPVGWSIGTVLSLIFYQKGVWRRAFIKEA